MLYLWEFVRQHKTERNEKDEILAVSGYFTGETITDLVEHIIGDVEDEEYDITMIKRHMAVNGPLPQLPVAEKTAIEKPAAKATKRPRPRGKNGNAAK